MANRVLSIATFISAVLLGCTVLLWLSAFVLNPWSNSLSVTGEFHIGIWGGRDGPWLGRVVFFNDREYGPYRGSIIAVCDEDGNTYPNYRLSAWGDCFGVYYRHIYFPESNGTLWTLMISLVYPFGLFAALPLAWGWGRWRKMRALPITATRKVACADRPTADE